MINLFQGDNEVQCVPVNNMLSEQIPSFLTADFVFIKMRWKCSFSKELWTRFPPNSYAQR